MKKYILITIIILILITTVGAISQKTNKDTIKIGFIGALSGDGAAYGETEKNTTEIAINEINNSGGIKGRKIEIIYEDGKCSGKDATNAIYKLINIDKVNIILGGTCSSETLAIAPIAEQNKILLLSAFSSNPTITNAGDYIFRNSPSDSDVAKLDAHTIASKYKTVAMLSENTDYSQGVHTIMNKIFQDKGITVVSDEVYTSGTKDFRSVLIKMKETNPEVMYINPGTDIKAGGLIVKQARELGIKVPIHGNLNLATTDAIVAGGEFMNGVVSDDSTGLSNKGNALLKKYISIYGKAPSIEFEMGAAYDRVYIIKNAIESVGTDPTNIKNYLYKITDFDGALGKYHFDSNGDVVGIGFMNIVLQDGNKIPYNQ